MGINANSDPGINPQARPQEDCPALWGCTELRTGPILLFLPRDGTGALVEGSSQIWSIPSFPPHPTKPIDSELCRRNQKLPLPIMKPLQTSDLPPFTEATQLFKKAMV